jgi:predicted RNase H-like HicB family nuclease
LEGATIFTVTYFIQLIPEQEGGYSVRVPGLPGCYSQGETREEAIENVKEAICLWLEAAAEDPEPFPEIETVQVTIDAA